MNDFKSGVLSLKPTDKEGIKLRLVIPRREAALEAGKVSTPEFKISVVLPENQYDFTRNFFETEKDTLEILKAAVDRRIKEVTAKTGV